MRPQGLLQCADLRTEGRLADADLAGRFAVRLLAEGVYATAFSFPVVPNGTARIRTQMNADHTDADLDVAVAAFTKVGQELGVVS